MTYCRRLPGFEYVAPKTIKEALAFLANNKGEVKVVAGGTDLLPQMKHRLLIPKYLISFKNIHGLDYIKYDRTDGLRFGPSTTIASIDSFSFIQNKFNILAQATSTIGSPQIRNVATLAGNICSAVPSADAIPALMVLGAKLKLLSSTGERGVAIEDFFIGPRQTILREDELLMEIQLAETQSSSKAIYLKQGLRRAMSLATASVAVMITMEDNYCQDIRIALGAVAPVPLRATRAELILRGKSVDDTLIDKAAQLASTECSPVSDIRSTEQHRRHLTYVLTRRAIKQTLPRAAGLS